MFQFTAEERDRRWQKVRNAMAERGLEALVICSQTGHFGTHTANLRYLANLKTEGYLAFPLQGEPTIFTFSWQSALKTADQMWITDWRVGHPNYSKTISDRLKELHLESGRIGIVGLSGYYGEAAGFPHTTYVSIADALPKAHLEDATDILEDVRRIKSDAEIRCLEQGCDIANRAIQAVKNVAKVGTKDYEIRATIIDTLFRNGCDRDSMLLYCSGKEIAHAGQGGPLRAGGERSLEEGDVILTEFDVAYQGYMAQHNQPFSIGRPSKEWSEMFHVVSAALSNGLKTLRAGITAGELEEAVLLPIKESGYSSRNTPFHGIGLRLEMPLGTMPVQPAYKPNKSLTMQEGMTLEFEPNVVASEGKKGLHLGCPVLVTKTGCRMLNKSWKPELITC